MKIIDQLKILDNKIKPNKAQYDLDRELTNICALSSGELEKYEYLTGEDLGYKPNVIQKAKFEYSPLGKVFNKGLDESNQKEELLKRLKNFEGKNKDQLDEIKYQGQKQLDVIEKQGKNNLKSINKQEKQLKKNKNQKEKLIEKIEREEKSEKIALLRDNLNNILMVYDMDISIKGKNILRKLADDEKNINYKNLFFKSGNLAIDNYDFFKRFGTLYDLLIDLLNGKISLRKAKIEQNEMINKIIELKNFIFSEEEKIDKGAIKKGKKNTGKKNYFNTKKCFK